MGKYKHGKPNAEIELSEFRLKVEKSNLSLRQKAYLVLLWWSGCRRREPLVILKEDVSETAKNLYLTITYDPEIEFSRCKNGLAGGPLILPKHLWGVSLIREVWKKTRKGQRLFPFCDNTGYNAFKKLFPKKSPHWLRHNRITKLRKLRDKKMLSTDDIKSFTGLKSDRHVEHYGMKTIEGVQRVSNVLE